MPCNFTERSLKGASILCNSASCSHSSVINNMASIFSLLLLFFTLLAISLTNLSTARFLFSTDAIILSTELQRVLLSDLIIFSKSSISRNNFFHWGLLRIHFVRACSFRSPIVVSTWRVGHRRRHRRHRRRCGASTVTL